MRAMSELPWGPGQGVLINQFLAEGIRRAIRPRRISLVRNRYKAAFLNVGTPPRG